MGQGVVNITHTKILSPESATAIIEKYANFIPPNYILSEVVEIEGSPVISLHLIRDCQCEALEPFKVIELYG
jgi:hypothetical protein